MRDIDPQYRIIQTGAGWAPKSTRGRLRFAGRDRASFLQALLTNEIAAVDIGAGAYALYLTPQGRLITDLHVFVRPDCIISDVPVALSAELAATFDRLIFSEDVSVVDQSAALSQITVAGAASARVIAAAFDLEAAALDRLPLWSQHDISGGFVVRTDDALDGSWDVCVDGAEAAAAIAALQQAGAVEVATELLDVLRIEAGRPRFGVDMTTDTIPLEAGLLDRAISQTKGCYVGQEVIIRILHRGGGRVAKRLVRIDFAADVQDVPPAGTPILADDAETGHITSACWSPRFQRVIALGYVHRDVAESGREVTVGSAVGVLS